MKTNQEKFMNGMISNFKLFTLLLVGMFLAVGITSCGDDDDDPIAVTPATQTEQSVSEAAKTNGHEAVDLGLSVKWATCNIGAEKPEDYGYYFAWGETAPKEIYDWSTYKFNPSGDGNTMTKYNVTDGKEVLDAADDAATVNWGGAWRMPTLEEAQELLNNCTWEWQAAGNTAFGGVAGYKVTSNKDGYADKYIFLPVAGRRRDTDVRDADSKGRYWSSSRDADPQRHAYALQFSSNHKYWEDQNRYYGFTVRPVLQ